MASQTALPSVARPVSLAHVVLKTPPEKFDAMRAYYKTFLDAEPAFENPYLCFLRYDEEHHRIGIVALPGTTPKPPGAAGLAHVAFTFATLKDLLLAYQQRKAHGILPSWCVNHGVTTSIYYTDPDGNEIETQVDNFDTPAEADKFLTSEEFAINPIGTDFDVEDLICRLESGVPETELKTRVEIGPRMVF
ncbi:hypothetical protein G7Y89_g1659 [Cudoniella acicularis]|uniref:VOC domain-containing protein n=1 Tax=Cudoniella acicularis TaxID=354080 RepID=A0A8H4WA23_9HELO|nr:hypothetical protein G7Y89_g1659 [Cudoniella acicularis]